MAALLSAYPSSRREPGPRRARGGREVDVPPADQVAVQHRFHDPYVPEGAGEEIRRGDAGSTKTSRWASTMRRCTAPLGVKSTRAAVSGSASTKVRMVGATDSRWAKIRGGPDRRPGYPPRPYRVLPNTASPLS